MNSKKYFIRTLVAGILAVAGSWLAVPVHAVDPSELLPVEIGKPTRIEVHPGTIKLTSSRQFRQLVVTAHYADGQLQDITRVAEIVSANPQVAEVEKGIVRPRGNGTSELLVKAGGQEAKVAVQIAGQKSTEAVSFAYETLAALSKQGCNAGACHGSPSGKGGFRLSLRAFDAALDQVTLIREDFGRRTNVLDASESLLLLKPLMKVAHGGGRQIRKTDYSYGLLENWISEGCKLDPEKQARCVRIEVYPSSGRVLQRPAHTQQLSVLAHYSDGSIRDITPLAVYTSSDTEVALVDEDGLVVGQDRGQAAVIVRYLEFIESSFLTFVKDVEGYEWVDVPTNNYVDQHVHAKLKQLKYLPSELCSDEEFIRRLYLDVIGFLPSTEELVAFAQNPAADKRSKLIDQLLGRPEHAKFWALKWGDLLRLTNSQVGGDGVYKYYRWLERSLRENMPYDQFAEELLTATGSTMNNPPANFYRTAGDTNDCVETISQIFLGARLQCAKCHNHPFERWTQDNYYGMAAFFNRVQRKKTRRADELFVWTTNTGEVTQPRTGKQMKPWLPIVGDVEKETGNDRREIFATWLTGKDNPYFGKIEVNRIWSHLLGRGIVDPPDDFRDTNPPSNADLLDALAKDFSEHGYDRQHMMRVILNSRVYQMSFRPNSFNETDTKYFSHFQPRLLSAEQLLDAICHVTNVSEQFGSLPAGIKATQLPAPDLVKHDFLRIFGQPERQTVCACERSTESNLGMAIQFFNGPLVYNKLRNEKNRFRELITAKKTDEEIVDSLYKAAVCRPPTKTEMEASLKHIKSKEDRILALEDVCWAILNTNEFLFQH
ncbi:MAG: DUF1549 domain-containing protein [Planctomycetaceae bacterium]|nr:DUF1549 domain-containing protein [Planctomycetaceae bacterium]